MTQHRVTATTQISTVVDVLQLGKKTGILNVERGSGETFEEGMVAFVNGQVVQSVIGSYTGRDASIKLSLWTACRFSFVPMQSEEVRQKILPLSQNKTNTTPRTEKTQKLPIYGSQKTKQVAQDNLYRQPWIAMSYKGARDDLLLTLDHLGFSRTHRRLFLLIDGRRSISELAMLISRTPDETMTLLIDLRQARLIQL
jgi:hypothetical protein